VEGGVYNSRRVIQTDSDVFQTYELTSSILVQTMINKIFQDLINTREVVSFIDDVIVRTEGEEEHNEVVEEVVKKLAESDLYVKLEKYKLKIREVEFFLEVVIGLEEIKMEKEKV